MRPVNLIPPEDRRGDHAPLRAGSMSYIIVGAIAAGLLAVVALVLTQNSITEHENEIAQLEVARDAATEKAQALAPYAEFASLQGQRELTITTLAQSRFDWERVLRELAIVIPADVSLTNLEATVASESSDAGATEGTGAPTLVMTGCATDHDTVATFVAALEDIDGVTRVGLDNSTAGGGGAVPSTGDEDGCSSSGLKTTFAVRAAFDGVGSTAASAVPATPPADAAQPAGDGGTNSLDEQVGEAQNATNLVPGAAR
jgi:Tfp pilus assembly protein PilN